MYLKNIYLLSYLPIVCLEDWQIVISFSCSLRAWHITIFTDSAVPLDRSQFSPKYSRHLITLWTDDIFSCPIWVEQMVYTSQWRFQSCVHVVLRVPLFCDICLLSLHSVESPSMVDPQWNIWYWGSKWNLHTVCWSVVGCEWGTTSVYFGITYVCFIPSRLPVFAVEPQYLLQYFLFLSKVSFELHIQNLQKNSCWFKIWMGFVGPILIKLWTSSIWGFL